MSELKEYEIQANSESDTGCIAVSGKGYYMPLSEYLKQQDKITELEQQLKQQWVSVDDAKKYEDCEVVYYCDFCGTKEVGFVMHGVVNRLGLVGDYIPVDDVNLLLPLPPTK